LRVFAEHGQIRKFKHESNQQQMWNTQSILKCRYSGSWVYKARGNWWSPLYSMTRPTRAKTNIPASSSKDSALLNDDELAKKLTSNQVDPNYCETKTELLTPIKRKGDEVFESPTTDEQVTPVKKAKNTAADLTPDKVIVHPRYLNNILLEHCAWQINNTHGTASMIDKNKPQDDATFVLIGKVVNPQVSIYGDYNSTWHNDTLVGVNYSFALAAIENAASSHDNTIEKIKCLENLLPEFSSCSLEKHRIVKRGSLIMLKRKLGRKTIKSVHYLSLTFRLLGFQLIGKIGSCGLNFLNKEWSQTPFLLVFMIMMVFHH
jgi:hypothetical protein